MDVKDLSDELLSNDRLAPREISKAGILKVYTGTAIALELRSIVRFSVEFYLERQGHNSCFSENIK